jgi:hypothetical protein
MNGQESSLPGTGGHETPCSYRERAAGFDAVNLLVLELGAWPQGVRRWKWRVARAIA